jgi:hypothetical protein
MVNDGSSAQAAPVDTSNHFMVCAYSGGHAYLILRPPTGPMTPELALNLAAYLVAMADPMRERFDAVLAAVCAV